MKIIPTVSEQENHYVIIFGNSENDFVNYSLYNSQNEIWTLQNKSEKLFDGEVSANIFSDFGEMNKKITKENVETAELQMKLNTIHQTNEFYKTETIRYKQLIIEENE